MELYDIIYAFESTRYYNPASHLLEIKAPLIAINSADDQVNTIELGLMEKEIKRLKMANSYFFTQRIKQAVMFRILNQLYGGIPPKNC